MFLITKIREDSWDEYRHASDEQLLEEYRVNGNKDLVGLLFERYTHLVYGICLQYLKDSDTCQDAVMEIFESLFEKLSEHRVILFKNWLYSVSKNYCLMTLRKMTAHKRLKEHAALLAPKYEDTPTEEFEGNAMMEARLDIALKRLSEEQRLCVSLLYLKNKSYHEISLHTGFSIKQVKSHIQNGKRNLKNYLLSYHDFFCY